MQDKQFKMYLDGVNKSLNVSALEVYRSMSDFPKVDKNCETAALLDDCVARGARIPMPKCYKSLENESVEIRSRVFDLMLRIMAWNYMVEKNIHKNWKKDNPLIPPDYFNFREWYGS